jgi:hypothetical protein
MYTLYSRIWRKFCNANQHKIPSDCARGLTNSSMHGSADGTKLSINPIKTVISFTRKRDNRELMEPTLFGNTIQLSSEAKYHGLTLDKGLTLKSNWIKQPISPIGPFGGAEADLGNLWE